MTAFFDRIDALPPWLVIFALAVLIVLLAYVFIRKKPKQNPPHDKSPAPVAAEDGAKENSHNHDIRK